jgi:probable HAF family extracellular repeat protein
MTTLPLARLARRRSLGRLLIVLVGFVCALGALPAAQARPLAQTSFPYTVTDLGTLGGQFSFATDINNRGQVIGSSAVVDGASQHAYLWQAGELIDLGAIGLDNQPVPDGNFYYSSPNDINDAGQIVGEYNLVPPEGDGKHGAFIWQHGVVTELGSLGGSYTAPLAINEQGQVIGFSTIESETAHAFLWQAGVMTDLGTLGSEDISSFARAINNHGQIVGVSYKPNGDSHGFLWQNGVMTDLGTLGSDYIGSSAVAINEQGQIIGNSITPDINDRGSGEQHGFLWQHGVMTDLGWLGGYDSSVADINERGQIVASNSDGQALLWQDGVLTSLTGACCSGGAGDINEQGEVVGWFIAANGEPHAWVWRAGVLTDLGSICGRGACGGGVFLNERGQIATMIEGHATLWTPRDVTPQQHVSALKQQLDDVKSFGGVSQGQYQALAAKLDAAQQQLAQQHPQAVANQLRAFVTQVDAFQQTGVFSSGRAQWLRDPANAIIAELG